MTGQFVGSPAYAAPEALVKGITGAASDVYGLGATLYEAACGKWPRLEAEGRAARAGAAARDARARTFLRTCAAAIDRAVAFDARAAADRRRARRACSATDPARRRRTPAAPRRAPPRALKPWAIGGAVSRSAGVRSRRDSSRPRHARSSTKVAPSGAAARAGDRRRRADATASSSDDRGPGKRRRPRGRARRSSTTSRSA